MKRNREKLDTLPEKYPRLFKNNKFFDPANGPSRKGCFYFQCSDGWYDILDATFFHMDRHLKRYEEAVENANSENPRSWNVEFLEKHPQDPGEEFVIDQIKEKFGGLRIYFSGKFSAEDRHYFYGLTTMAESMSYRTCEDCGNRGERRKGSWVITLCDDCHKKEEKDEIQ